MPVRQEQTSNTALTFSVVEIVYRSIRKLAHTLYEAV